VEPHSTIEDSAAPYPAVERYSPEVDARRVAGFGSVSALLETHAARPSAYAESPNVSIPAQTVLRVTRDPKTPSQHAFLAAVEAVADARQTTALRKYPQLAHWLRCDVPWTATGRFPVGLRPFGAVGSRAS
jgi:hypothetical protein